MKITSLHQTTSLERVQPESGFGDVGEGGIVAGQLGIPMVGTLGDGQVWIYDAGSGALIPGDPGSPNAELNIEGGQDVIKAHGSVGSTVSIDPTDGNIHTLTLTANCTATISAPVGAGGADLILWVTQDGTGGWTFTVAATGGTVTDDGTLTPSTTAGVTVRYITERKPGTTNDWIRDLAGGGGGGSALTIKDEGTPLATAATSLDFVGAGVVASGTGAGKTITVAGTTTAAVSAMGVAGPLLTSDSPSSPLVFADILQNEAQTDFMYADLLGV